MDEVYNNQYGFEVPDEHIPTDEELQRLSDGDEEIIPVICEGVTQFVLEEMNWLIATNTHLIPYKEDVFSESFLAVAEVCHYRIGSPPLTSARFLAIVKKAATVAVMTWVFQQQLPFSVPTMSLYRKADQLKAITTRQPQESDRQTNDDGVFSEVWFDDFIQSLDDRDCSLIRLKLEGKSNREIGREVGLEHKHVARRLSELLAMYKGD